MKVPLELDCSKDRSSVVQGARTLQLLCREQLSWAPCVPDSQGQGQQIHAITPLHWTLGTPP